MKKIISSLPQMTGGSEKQIAWAEKIRAEKMELLARGCELALADAEGDADMTERMKEKLELAARKSAVWWIDNRNMLTESVWNSSTKTWTTRPYSDNDMTYRIYAVLDSIR